MEALKRQASKFREQVAKQQQALFRQFGHFGGEAFAEDDAEIARHHQLQNLYTSTRAAKHFEKDIVHGVEGLMSVNLKEIDIDRRFAQDCSKYEVEKHCSSSPLAQAAMHIHTSRNSMVKEKETLLGVFDEQVCKPLRALVRCSELEDARLLVRRYEKLWQEVEAQAADVTRLRSKVTEGSKSGEKSIKLRLADEKLDELRSRLSALGKEASSAMLSVEAQQQRMTFQQLVVLVNAERSFHRNVLGILDKLHTEMVEVEQQNDMSPAADASQSELHVKQTEGHVDLNRSTEHFVELEDKACFAAKVVHPFDGQSERELSLLADDIIIVHQEIPGGWSKGECNGKSGWFPTPYVHRLDILPTGSIAPTSQ